MCSPFSLPTLFYHLSLIRAHSEITMCVIKKERLGYKKSIRVERKNLNIYIWWKEQNRIAPATFHVKLLSVCFMLAPLSEITDSHF